MYFNKLIILLQRFDKPMLKKLDTYVQSPYFKVPVSSVCLFNYLQKQHPEFDEKNLNPALIAAKVPKLINANKQAKAATELLKAVEHFLTVEQLELKPNLKNMFLLQSQKRIGVKQAFENTIGKVATDINLQEEKDIDYFFFVHLLTEIKFNGFDAKLQRNTGNDLKPVTDTFETYYAIKKLRYHCELYSRHQIIGTTYEPGNIQDLLKVLRPYTNPQYPYVYLFVNIYQMLVAPTFQQGEVYYNILADFIAENQYKVLPQGVRESIPYLINYSLMWNNMGYDKAGTYALNWYETLINYKLLPEDGRIQPSDYRNIVTLAIINKRNTLWLKKFIDDNEACLPQEHRDINLAYALAQYYTYTSNYSKAMPLFQQALVKDEPIFNMIVRSSQFRCMYEGAQNAEVLLYFLTSWQRQLHRYTPSLHLLKKVFARQITYSRKLLLANNIKDKAKVLAEINKEPFFSGKHWLVLQLKK